MAIAKGYRAVYERYLTKAVANVAHGDARVHGPKRAATGSVSADFDALEVSVQGQLKAMVSRAFETMWDNVYAAHEENSTLPRINIGGRGGLGERVKSVYETQRDASIELVENAQRVYSEQVREIFGNPDNFGVRVEELQKMLQERGDVSESRAELIARDQTLKTLGGINEARQKDAGVDSYTWSTSLDERVRPDHEELEGQVFSWGSPPEPGHPGEDFQCRCVAIPVIDELADLDDMEAF